MVAFLMGLYFGTIYLLFSRLKLAWTKNRIIGVCVAGFLVLLILILGWKISAPTIPSGAFATGPVLEMRSDVSGRVVQVWVTKPRDVKKGEPLFQIDPEPYRFEMDRAEAKLEQAKSDIAALKDQYTAAVAAEGQAKQHIHTLQASRKAAEAQVETLVDKSKEAERDLAAAEANVVQSRAQSKAAEIEVEMAREAFKTSAVSQLQLTEAEKAAEASRAAVVAAEATRDKARIRLEQTLKSELAGARATAEQARSAVTEAEDALKAATAQASELKTRLNSTIDGEHTEIRQARESYEIAKWNYEHTTTYAPVDGFVIDPTLREGAMVRALDKVMSVVSDEDRWVIARVPQYLADFIEEGNEVEMTFAMYPGRIFSGKLTKRLWAAGESQKPTSGSLPDLNTVQGSRYYAVRIDLDEMPADAPLRFGATGTASVYTEYWKPFRLIQKMVINMEAWMNYLP
ncbi:MAG: HlyD family secretion protein [Planctomycetota bacterium]